VIGRILSGKPIAAAVLQSVTERAGSLISCGIRPQLAFVMHGASPPAQVYAARLERQGERVGIQVARRELPEDVSIAALEAEIAALNADDAVDGILVQMPLPPHLLGIDLSSIIDPRKDADGITIQNAGRLYLGLPGQAPPTALAVMQILHAASVKPTGRHAVLVGRSNVVGHPVAELLLLLDATVTVTHRQTDDLGAFTRQADILVVAAGEPRLITADMIRPGVVIVDAGINVTPEGIVGDVDFEACKEVAGAITPVPGGVGPVTNAVLLRNVVSSAERRGG
jgi:methylenetetrahydrofolate dehydrogenase (NADP+)/methenyltetrahydrofolate cyclohydrolase